MSRRVRLPAHGSPNTSVEERDNKGSLIRRRFYGGDGRAIKDIDYQPHHGHVVPHAHDWDWTQESPRQAARPLRSGE